MYPILIDLGVWQLRSYGVFVALAAGDPPMVAGIIVPQAISVALVVAALASLIVLRRSVWRVQRPAVG